jgi:hypothetical protein
MSKSEELRTQLAVTEMEEELAAAKASDDGPSRDLKQRVREAREQYRSTYRTPSTAVEDGTAEPAPVEASATVKE